MVLDHAGHVSVRMITGCVRCFDWTGLRCVTNGSELPSCRMRRGAGDGRGGVLYIYILFLFFRVVCFRAQNTQSCVGYTGGRLLSRRSYISTREIVHRVCRLVLL